MSDTGGCGTDPQGAVMATIRAYVYKDQKFGFYKVSPAVVVLSISNKDDFELVNTDVDHPEATWTVPIDIFASPIKKEKFKKRSGKKTPKSRSDVIVVEYEVEVDGKKAIGHSDPVIIIDP
jgi:hypothetical protein